MTIASSFQVGLDYNLSPVIRWPKKGKLVTSFVWFKAGLLVAGPNGSIKVCVPICTYCKLFLWDFSTTLSYSKAPFGINYIVNCRILFF